MEDLVLHTRYIVRLFSALLLSLLFSPRLAVSQTCSDATVCQNAVFCTGFEEANPKSNWDDWDGNPDSQNLVLQEPGPCNSGSNKVMRLIGHGADMRKNFRTSSYDKLYFRWYEKFEAGYDFTWCGGSCHGVELAAGLPPGADGRTDWLWDIGMFISNYRPPLVSGYDPSDGTYLQPFYKAYFDLTTTFGSVSPHLYSYYHAMFMDGDGDCGGVPCFNVTGPVGSAIGGVFGDIFPCVGSLCEGNRDYEGNDLGISSIQLGKWYCFEIMVDGGTPSNDLASASGQENFWIDGREAGPFTKLWMRADPNVKLRAIYIPNSYSGNVLVDNIVVSTQRIGCLGSPVAPTVPSAPTNLRFVQ